MNWNSYTETITQAESTGHNFPTPQHHQRRTPYKVAVAVVRGSVVLRGTAIDMEFHEKVNRIIDTCCRALAGGEVKIGSVTIAMSGEKAEVQITGTQDSVLVEFTGSKPRWSFYLFRGRVNGVLFTREGITVDVKGLPKQFDPHRSWDELGQSSMF